MPKLLQYKKIGKDVKNHCLHQKLNIKRCGWAEGSALTAPSQRTKVPEKLGNLGANPLRNGACPILCDFTGATIDFPPPLNPGPTPMPILTKKEELCGFTTSHPQSCSRMNLSNVGDSYHITSLMYKLEDSQRNYAQCWSCSERNSAWL
jgi:hypothetical protein